MIHIRRLEFLIFILVILLNSCEVATILEGIENVPKDYIEVLELDSTEMKQIDVFIPKVGRPAVNMLYRKTYELFFFSCEPSVNGRLIDFLSFKSSSKIGISPNISYTGNVSNVQVELPIKYDNLIAGPSELVTQPDSKNTIVKLNDSTTFILLKDSRGFEWRSLSKDYAGIVVNVLENQITKFDGKADLGILIYHRRKRDYLLVAFGIQGQPLQLNDLFDALDISWAGGDKHSVNVVKGQ